MAPSFRNLLVWQRAIELTIELYRLTEDFPTHEKYGLTSQMCRAAVSIPSNVAEGSGRASRREYRRFVLIAKGSANELQTQLVIAQRLAYGDQVLLSKVEGMCLDVGRKLHGLERNLRDQIAAATARVTL